MRGSPWFALLFRRAVGLESQETNGARELPPDVFYVSTLPVKMYPHYFAMVTLASLTICLLATIYPARQASRLLPVDVMRYE